MPMLRWSLKDIVQVIEDCVNDKFDVIIFVEGNRGLGKSTLLFKLGLRLNSRGVIKFKPKRHMVYSREDTIKLLASKTKHFIFSDEMINVAYNRDFYEQDQKVLLKALNMYRDSYNVFAGAIPKFVDLDTQIRKLCKIRITVIRRGVALVHTQLRGIYRSDPWDTKENIKIEMKSRKGKKRYGKLSTVRGILYFTDLRENQRVLYEEIKKTKRGKVYSEYTDDKEEDDLNALLIDRVLEFKTSKAELETYCVLTKRKWATVLQLINSRLRDTRADHTASWYFNETERRREAERKDKLKSKKFVVKPKEIKVSLDSSIKSENTSHSNLSSETDTEIFNLPP